MEPEFMLPTAHQPIALRTRFDIPEPHPADYDRALSKNEIIEILATDDIEFELLLANELLSPSLTLEYHRGGFLGFFTYWDCLSAQVATILLGYVRDIDMVADLTEEFVPNIAAAIIDTQSSLTAKQEALRQPLLALMDELMPLCSQQDKPLNRVELMHELGMSLSDLDERFRILVACESPLTVAPFALNCSITTDHRQN